MDGDLKNCSSDNGLAVYCFEAGSGLRCLQCSVYHHRYEINIFVFVEIRYPFR